MTIIVVSLYIAVMVVVVARGVVRSLLYLFFEAPLALVRSPKSRASLRNQDQGGSLSNTTTIEVVEVLRSWSR